MIGLDEEADSLNTAASSAFVPFSRTISRSITSALIGNSSSALGDLLPSTSCSHLQVRCFFKSRTKQEISITSIVLITKVVKPNGDPYVKPDNITGFR